MQGEWEEIYRADARSEWIFGAYDEDGEQVYCDACRGEIQWDPQTRIWRCTDCGLEKTRIGFFRYIGANPPGARCLVQCQENYPFCKRSCPWYDIDRSDPMA